MHQNDYYGDQFKWFVGVVKELGPDGKTARVRIYGIHRMDDTTDVSDGDLPLAVVLTPTTGGNTLALGNGDWVMGFFADGNDCQQPVIVGAIGGSMYGDSTTSGMGGDFGADGSLEDVNVPGGDIPGKVYNFLRSRWESIHGNADQAHCQSCGIMGHMYVESRWHITAKNAGEQAIGLCQWRFERRQRLLAMSRPNYPSLTQQCSYVFWELEHTHHTAYQMMMAAHTTRDAVVAFSHFELHAGVTGHGINYGVANAKAAFQTRMGAALKYDRMFKGNYTAPEYSAGPNGGGVAQTGSVTTADRLNDEYFARGPGGGTTY